MLLDQEKLTAVTNYKSTLRRKKRRSNALPGCHYKESERSSMQPRIISLAVAHTKTKQREIREKDEETNRYSITTSQIVETCESQVHMQFAPVQRSEQKGRNRRSDDQTIHPNGRNVWRWPSYPRTHTCLMQIGSVATNATFRLWGIFGLIRIENRNGETFV